MFKKHKPVRRWGTEKVQANAFGYSLCCRTCLQRKVGGKEGSGWFCKPCKGFFCDDHIKDHYDGTHIIEQLAGDDDE